MGIGLRNGWWWPVADKECYQAVLGTVQDMGNALGLVKNRSLCFQAGGNCGVWASQLADYFTEVWTVEADWENYLCLVRNVPRNVRTTFGALGARPGTTGLHKFERNAGAHYVEGTGRIPVLTIDEFNLPACDLLILDIEGSEPMALEGAKKTIEQLKPIIMVEDKGLSEMYGYPQDWSGSFPGYRVVSRVHRDVILAPQT